MSDLDQAVSWESLESYINTYSGRIKIIRLLHIANHSESLKIQAWKLALSVLKAESLDTTTFETVTQSLKSVEPDLRADEAWVTTATRTADATTAKLEQELKAYKNNLIKESIRMGQQDISNHYIKTGDLSSALRTQLRSRDYCTSPSQHFANCMDVINTLILLGRWHQVMPNVVKAETFAEQTKGALNVKDHLTIATALVHLHDRKYKEAAQQLMMVDASVGSTFNSIITMNDISNFTCLLALATFSRAEIHDLSESASLKPFLELEIASREALSCFSKGRYAECSRLINSIKPNMMADVFFEPHVKDLYTMISERGLLQFAEAFQVVSLDRMCTVFNVPSAELEDLLVGLITSGKLQHTRLDMKSHQLVHEGKQLRESVYQKALDVSDRYEKETARALYHLAVSHAGLKVEQPVAKFLEQGEQSIYDSTVPEEPMVNDEEDQEMMALT